MPHEEEARALHFAADIKTFMREKIPELFQDAEQKSECNPPEDSQV